MAAAVLAPPPGVRVMDTSDGCWLVEFDEPCTLASARDGPDYVLTIAIPSVHPIVFASGGPCWLDAQCCAYALSVGRGENMATVGRLVYNERETSHVTLDTIAQGVQCRFGAGAPPLGTIVQKLSTMYAACARLGCPIVSP